MAASSSDDEIDTSVGGHVADDELFVDEELLNIAGDRAGRRGRVRPVAVPVDAAESAEIVALSDRIRRAIECPVCLLLPADLACLCPNGHAVCSDCLTQVWNRDTEHYCPLCRAKLAPTQDAQVTASKLEEVVPNVMVSCAHRSLGCPELHAVYDVTGHEAQCAHAPDIRCLVSVCQWIGVYDQLFIHVQHAHHDVALEAATNHLAVYDLNSVARNRRRTHLVRTPHGLFWIVLTRVSRGRIRAGVFVVEQRSSGGGPQRQNPNLAYRVTTISVEGQARTRSRIRQVAWTSSLKDNDRGDGGGGGLDDTYTAIRSRRGSVEFTWWFEPGRRNATPGRCVAPWSTAVAATTTTATNDHPI